MFRTTGIHHVTFVIAAAAILSLAGCGQDPTYKTDVEGKRILAERDACYDRAAKGPDGQFGPAIERCDQAAGREAQAVIEASQQVFNAALDKCLALIPIDDGPYDAAGSAAGMATLNRCLEADGKWVRTLNAGWQEVVDAAK